MDVKGGQGGKKTEGLGASAYVDARQAVPTGSSSEDVRSRQLLQVTSELRPVVVHRAISAQVLLWARRSRLASAEIAGRPVACAFRGWRVRSSSCQSLRRR